MAFSSTLKAFTCPDDNEKWAARVADIINDEFIEQKPETEEDEEEANSCKGKCKSFFFGDPVIKTADEHRVKNVCTSAAIFKIQKSWERKKGDNDKIAIEVDV